MKDLREAIPEIARTEARTKETPETIVFSTSTDANTAINPEYIGELSPDQLMQVFHTILEPYLEYEEKIEELAGWAKEEGIEVTTRRYGHMNPRNIDAHTRVTVKGTKEKQTEFNLVKEYVLDCKQELLTQIKNLPHTDKRIITTHGEKGKIPGKSFLNREEIEESLERINQAGETFNFRIAKV